MKDARRDHCSADATERRPHDPVKHCSRSPFPEPSLTAGFSSTMRVWIPQIKFKIAPIEQMAIAMQNARVPVRGLLYFPL